MADNRKLHVAVFPWLAFGHLIPFFEVAKFIAQKGHKISFLSTPRNMNRLPTLPPGLVPCFDFVNLTLPRIENLPENAEATMDVPPEDIHFLKKAFDGLEDELTQFLESSTPDWIIYDFAPYWLPPIAARLRISRAHFFVINAWFLDFFGPTSWKRTLETSNKPGGSVTDAYRLGSAISGCDMIIIRHCFEFEPLWLNLLEELHHKPVIPLGLMPPALGSEVGLSQDELTELALGLELSGLSFFWALRRSDSLELPNGFLERVKDRGIVWETWAPQSKILSHDSVGSFLTHCGWSSIIEGLEFGRALIMLPIAVDQGLNARILVDSKVGVEIPRDENDGSFTRNSVAESVKKVTVCEDGQIFRDKAKELSYVFGDKDMHSRYMNSFIEYLENHRPLEIGLILQCSRSQHLLNPKYWAMANEPKLHVVMFPWSAFGHIIPFLELAKFKAQRGHGITFISPPRIIDRLPEIPPIFASSITFVKIPLPRVGLPENAEATMDIRNEDIPHLKKAYDGLEPELTRFLESSLPDWIIFDFAPYWLPTIAAKRGISKAFFSFINSWFLAFLGPSDVMINDADPRSTVEDFIVPPKWVPFETKVAYEPYEINWILGAGQENLTGVSDSSRSGMLMKGSDVIALRQSYDQHPLSAFPSKHSLTIVMLGKETNSLCNMISSCENSCFIQHILKTQKWQTIIVFGLLIYKDIMQYSAMANEPKLHVVMFPWSAFGHIIPFLELAKFIAQRGHEITFISTPRNIDRLPEIPPIFASSITFVKIPLPRVGLPENAEATMDIRNEDIPHLKKAYDGLEPELTRFLESSLPDWIIFDFAPYWLPIAAKLGISKAFFSIINSWFLAFLGPSDVMINDADPRSTNLTGVSDSSRSGMLMKGSDVIALRQSYEFEGQWLKLLEELHQRKVIPLGLMPPQVEKISAEARPGPGHVAAQTWPSWASASGPGQLSWAVSSLGLQKGQGTIPQRSEEIPFGAG
ncbi:unnamed protein product [Coffea canephora]|uniref:UDP-glycosyltransferases domain-containing protein n=1 Tax=Coffea canephora TaxID=49390 RepID=A0A068TZ50_COFCA|nr:unnamed protein product [Coffea canephora]